jgi:hypothetical protein
MRVDAAKVDERTLGVDDVLDRALADLADLEHAQQCVMLEVHLEQDVAPCTALSCACRGRRVKEESHVGGSLAPSP